MTVETELSSRTWDLLVQTGYLNVSNDFVVEQSDVVESHWKSPGHAATVWRDGGLFTPAGTVPFDNGYQTTTALSKLPRSPGRTNAKSALRRVTFVLRAA